VLAMNLFEVVLSRHKMGNYQVDIINDVSAALHVRNHSKRPAFTFLKIDRIVNGIITNSIIQRAENAVMVLKDNVSNLKTAQFDILRV
jgi:hypothetical protein